MTLFSGDLGLFALLSGVSLLAVWVPLYRGARVCLLARAATRHMPGAALRVAAKQPPGARGEPLGVVMLRALVRTLREPQDEGMPGLFVLDATRQYVTHEYESSYARLISMYANLLPPIGFIGTTSGMLILFVSMQLSDASLELGALALALTSSIFALIGFAVLEGTKIRLYGRLLGCIDEVNALYHEIEEKRPARTRSGTPEPLGQSA